MTAWKDRGPTAQAQATALAARLNLPLNAAWDHYDAENHGRHETVGLTIGLIGDLRRHGLDDTGIAEFFGVSPAAIAGFSESIAGPRQLQPAN